MGATLFKLVAGLVGLSLFYCVFLVVRKHSALKTAVRFDGEVVGYVSGGGKGRTKRLKVVYLDEMGKRRTFDDPGIASDPPSRPIGAKVTVLRQADGTHEVLLFQSLYLGYWIWFCFAACFMGLWVLPFAVERIYGKLPEGAPVPQERHFGSEKKPLR